jgi:CHAD domain-containing protein
VAALLREAEEELAHLEAARDEEALHDFRVALRRLRSVARALRPWLGDSLRRKHERRLGAIARATTAARDAEVQLAWLARERPGASVRELPGIDWLAGRLEGQLRDARDGDLRATAARFRRLARRIAKALAGATGPAPAGPVPSFGALLADLLRSHAVELASALEAVGGPLDVEPGHAARIAGKRLRYLLEPLRGNRRADASPAVAVLKELQDLLGELHDAHVSMDTVAAALVEAAAGRAREAHAAVLAGDAGAGSLRLARRDPLARGLLFLDRRAVERAAAVHARLVGEWMPVRRGILAEAVAGVVEELAPPRRIRAPARRLPGRRSASPARHRGRGPARPAGARSKRK